jgi:nitric oxide reductase subunit C
VQFYLPGVNQNFVAGEGRLVWQRYNCQSCHQLYGLGGYLGPDLTNLTSSPGKDENYLRAMILSGSDQMPSFKLNDEEMKLLIQFLYDVDKSGDGRNFTFDVNWDGMIIESYE